MNNKKKIKILTLVFIVLIIFSIIIYKVLILKNQNISLKIQNQNKIESQLSDLQNTNINSFDNYKEFSSSGEINELNNSIKNNNFKKTIDISSKIIAKFPENSKLNTEQKIKKVSLQYLKLDSLLNNANYYYKEKEIQKEIEKISNEIKEIDLELFDNFYGNYYLGYSKEIIKDFTGALNYYNKALNYSTEDNKVTSSIILNQIGHLYDLQGDMNKAYEYYTNAYKLNKYNFNVSVNIARYLTRIGEYKKAEKFFQYSLNTRNKPLKSEIYFSLSSVELELNGFKPNINKSIEYARLSIKEFPDYPMGYVALARGYYMLNDSKYNKEIEGNLSKSIKLNPNGYESYYYYGLHLFDLGKVNDSINILIKSLDILDNDLIIMKNDKNNINYNIKNIILILILISKIEGNQNIEVIMDGIMKNPTGNFFIKNQLIRGKYGIFTNIKGIENYINNLN